MVKYGKAYAKLKVERRVYEESLSSALDYIEVGIKGEHHDR
jgi:hypothetical protein